MASMRASETPSKMLQRKISNKDHMAILRQSTLTVENAISAFQCAVKLGPDFVCTCCHRMMYRETVVCCNKQKYNKASSDVLEKVFGADLSYTSADGKEWLCKM